MLVNIHPEFIARRYCWGCPAAIFRKVVVQALWRGRPEPTPLREALRRAYRGSGGVGCSAGDRAVHNGSRYAVRRGGEPIRRVTRCHENSWILRYGARCRIYRARHCGLRAQGNSAAANGWASRRSPTSIGTNWTDGLYTRFSKPHHSINRCAHIRLRNYTWGTLGCLRRHPRHSGPAQAADLTNARREQMTRESFIKGKGPTGGKPLPPAPNALASAYWEHFLKFSRSSAATSRNRLLRIHATQATTAPRIVETFRQSEPQASPRPGGDCYSELLRTILPRQ
jgi:hypothetical protein